MSEAFSKVAGGKSFLEIGFGSGTNLEVAAERFELVIGTDILPLKNFPLDLTPKIELIRADKASCFRDTVFDEVAFNPPYLPSEKIEDVTVDGGAHGVEVPLEFMDSALRVLRRDGKILILLSNLGDTTMFTKYCGEHQLIARKILDKKLFFETLTVFLVTHSGTS